MNRYKKLFSNTLILTVGTFGSKLLVFLLMPLYTALLSTSEYSTAELITGTANLLIPLACIGVSNGIFRFAAERAEDRREVFSSSLALLFLGLLGFLALSPLFFLVGYFDGYVWLIVLYVLTADVQAVFAQYVRAIDRTKLFAAQGIFNTLATVAFNLVFLIGFDMGVTGYVLSVIVGNALTTLLLFFCSKAWAFFSFSKISGEKMKELLRFSLPLIPTTVCWLITDLSDRFLVTYYWQDAVNGVYSAAYKIPTVITLISSIFLQAWQFSAVSESEDEGVIRNFYTQVFKGFLAVVLLGTGTLILLSEFLTGLLLNQAYSEAATYMPTLLCAAALEGIVSFLATVYMVRKKTAHSLVTALSGAVTNLILNVLLIPKFGALGAAGATLASYALVLAMRLYDAPKLIRFGRSLERLIPGVLLLFVSAFAMTFYRENLWWISLVALVFIAAMNLPELIRSGKAAFLHRIG